MKLLITIIFIVLTKSAFTQDGWNNVTPAGNIPRLLSVYSIDENNVWVTGVDGTMLHTTDGGSNWESIQSNITVGLGKVQFINPDTGWVASSKYIYRTTDGGESWVEQLYLPSSDEVLYDIEFIVGLPGEPVWGFATGGLQMTWRTDDSGETWELIRGACGDGNFNSCSFVNKNNGWFVGAPSATFPATIMYTTDGGNTFLEQINPVSEPLLKDVYFANDQRGLAVGVYGQTLYTSDGGSNWEERPNGGSTWLEVFLTENGQAWSAGFSGKIAHSTDWGYTWQMQESGVNDLVWGIHFINDNEGWAVGQEANNTGFILHTTNGGVTDVNETSIATQFELYQNYPNPFNPTTTIRYQIPERSFVTLRVFDVLGNEVVSLLNEEKEAGSYESTFDAEGLSSGIYFYQMKAGKYIETKKMIMMK